MTLVIAGVHNRLCSDLVGLGLQVGDGGQDVPQRLSGPAEIGPSALFCGDRGRDNQVVTFAKSLSR